MKTTILKLTVLAVAIATLTACVEDNTYYTTEVTHTRAYYTDTRQGPHADYYSSVTPSAPPSTHSRANVYHHNSDYNTYSAQTPPAPPRGNSFIESRVSSTATQAAPPSTTAVSAAPAPAAAPTVASTATPEAPPSTQAEPISVSTATPEAPPA